jgi:hypothetical protein
MTTPLKLVQGDTRPPVVVQLSTALGPVDLSEVGTVVRLKFRQVGTTLLLATIVGIELPGYQPDPDDPTYINYASPYDVAGKGGRAQFSWVGTGALAGDPGQYEAEVEVTYPDGSIQTGFDIIKFSMRAQF